MINELEIIKGIQALFFGPVGRAFAVFCASWAIFLFIPLVVVAGLRKPLRYLRAIVIDSSLVLLFALLIANVASQLVERLRPFLISKETALWIPAPWSPYAFPSGHSSAAFAMAAVLAYEHPLLGCVAFIVAILVAFGRVAVGVHYPSDVLAGVLVGFGAFGLMRWTRRRFSR